MNTDIYKKKLEDERLVLMDSLSRMGKNVNNNEWEAIPTEVNEIESDENDMADRFEDYEKDSEEVRALSARLREIDHALLHMKNGKFGVCRVCGKKIEGDRMNANPAATTCKEHLNE